jgi:hypothetical protein
MVDDTGAIGLHFGASNIFPDGVSGFFPAAPTALQLYSTASSSNVLTLTAVMVDGG